MADPRLEKELSVVPTDQLSMFIDYGSLQIVIQPDDDSDLFVLEHLHNASEASIRVPAFRAVSRHRLLCRQGLDVCWSRFLSCQLGHDPELVDG
jgi:hypothetical protein